MYECIISDKNPDKIEEATHRFREIQHAYSVLSDAHEREWYDNHREAILRGEGSEEGEGERHHDSAVKLWEYFRSSAFDDYDDAENGFFAVYARVFRELDEEEDSAADEEDMKHTPSPPFGRSSSIWSEVQAFYNHWAAFATKKSFSWVDVYNVTTAPNRQYRRAMEKENKKERDKERRAFNERVRELVEFVRKRDPRVREQQVQQKRDKEEKARQEQARRQQLEEERVERMRRLQAEREVELRAEEEARKSGEGQDGLEQEEEESDEEEQELYCAVCKKKFRTEKQWRNHEQSKKHKDKVREVQGSEEEEDEEEDEEEGEENEKKEETLKDVVDADEDEEENEEEDKPLEDTEEKDHEGQWTKVKTPSVKKSSGVPAPKQQRGHDEGDEEEEEDEEDEGADAMNEISARMASFMGKKKSNRQPRGTSHNDTDDMDQENETVSVSVASDAESEEGRGTHRRRRRKPTTESAPPSSQQSSNAKEPKRQNHPAPAPAPPSASPPSPSPSAVRDSRTCKPSSSIKAPAKSHQSQSRSNKKGDAEGETSWHCNKCSEVFPTRNSLFKHIASTGHAIAEPVAAPGKDRRKKR